MTTASTMTSRRAAFAYGAATAQRSLRQQEADVFHHANGRLRAVRNARKPAVTRAVADNARLWNAVMDALREPGNRLPLPLRASLLSIGHAVLRETRAADPDLAFLISVNEQIAAGLAA